MRQLVALLPYPIDGEIHVAIYPEQYATDRVKGAPEYGTVNDVDGSPTIYLDGSAPFRWLPSRL